MSMSFKSMVRSVSPFVSKEKKKKTAAAPILTGSKAYHWDLSDVDLVVALEYFYSIQNVQKVKLVRKILAQFEGDEILLLQQLCERHDVGEQEMWEKYLVKGLMHQQDYYSHYDQSATAGYQQHKQDNSQFETPQAHHGHHGHHRSSTPNPVLVGKKSLKDLASADQANRRSASAGGPAAMRATGTHTNSHNPNSRRDLDSQSICSDDSRVSKTSMSSKQFINSLSAAAGNVLRRVSLSGKKNTDLEQQDLRQNSSDATNNRGSGGYRGISATRTTYNNSNNSRNGTDLDSEAAEVQEEDEEDEEEAVFQVEERHGQANHKYKYSNNAAATGSRRGPGSSSASTDGNKRSITTGARTGTGTGAEIGAVARYGHQRQEEAEGEEKEVDGRRDIDVDTGPGSEHYRQKQELLRVKRAANHNQPLGYDSKSSATTRTQFEKELMEAKYALHVAHSETANAVKQRDEVVKLFSKYVALNHQHYRETTHRQNAVLFAVHGVAFTYLKDNYRSELVEAGIDPDEESSSDSLESSSSSSSSNNSCSDSESNIYASRHAITTTAADRESDRGNEEAEEDLEGDETFSSDCNPDLEDANANDEEEEEDPVEIVRGSKTKTSRDNKGRYIDSGRRDEIQHIQQSERPRSGKRVNSGDRSRSAVSKFGVEEGDVSSADEKEERRPAAVTLSREERRQIQSVNTQQLSLPVAAASKQQNKQQRQQEQQHIQSRRSPSHDNQSTPLVGGKTRSASPSPLVRPSSTGKSRTTTKLQQSPGPAPVSTTRTGTNTVYTSPRGASPSFSSGRASPSGSHSSGKRIPAATVTVTAPADHRSPTPTSSNSSISEKSKRTSPKAKTCVSSTSDVDANVDSDVKADSDPLREQYELAKQYYQASLQQSQLVSKMSENNLNMVAALAASEPGDSRRSGSATRSGKPAVAASSCAPVADAVATPSVLELETDNDWIECFDPKTKRPYYHSKIRKKSVWKPPAALLYRRQKEKEPTILDVMRQEGVGLDGSVIDHRSDNLSRSQQGQQQKQTPAMVSVKLSQSMGAMKLTHTKVQDRPNVATKLSSISSSSAAGNIDNDGSNSNSLRRVQQQQQSQPLQPQQHRVHASKNALHSDEKTGGPSLGYSDKFAIRQYKEGHARQQQQLQSSPTDAYGPQAQQEQYELNQQQQGENDQYYDQQQQDSEQDQYQQQGENDQYYDQQQDSEQDQYQQQGENDQYYDQQQQDAEQDQYQQQGENDGFDYCDDASALTEESALRPQQGGIFDVMKQAMEGSDGRISGTTQQAQNSAMEPTHQRRHQQQHINRPQSEHKELSADINRAVAPGLGNAINTDSRPPSTRRRHPDTQAQAHAQASVQQDSNSNVATKWETTIDKNSGRRYWFNRYTRETSWKDPTQ